MKKFWLFGLGLGSAGSDRKLLSNSGNQGMLPAENPLQYCLCDGVASPRVTHSSQGSLHPVTGCYGGTKAGAIITTPDDSPQAVVTELRKIPSASELPPRLAEAFVPAIPHPSFSFAPSLLPPFPSADICLKSTPQWIFCMACWPSLCLAYWHRVKHHHHLC